MYSYNGSSILFKSITGKQLSFTPTMASIGNKFDDIYGYVNRAFECNPEFYKLYSEFMEKYFENEQTRFDVFLMYYPGLLNHINQIYELFKLEDQLNVKEDDRFDLNINLYEAKIIMRISFRCRFFLFCYLSESQELVPGQKKIFNSMIYKEFISTKIVTKLYSIIESIIMCTNPEKSGKKIWELFSYSQGYSYDSHPLKLLNSIFYKAIPSLQPDKNPIAYIITVARMELEWMLSTHLTYVCIPTSIDILSSSQYIKNDVLQTEVFYRVIVKNIFNEIADEYKVYKDVFKNNPYTIITNIAQPIVTKILNLPLKRLPLMNQCLINFYAHKFLSIYDNNIPLIQQVLVSATHVDKSKIDHNVVLPLELKDLISKKITGSRLSNYVVHLNKTTLKKIVTIGITNLYKYKFYNVLDKKYIELNWKEFCLEYIDFIFKLTSGAYDDFIMQERKRIMLEI